jgi:hypothetical protein
MDKVLNLETPIGAISEFGVMLSKSIKKSLSEPYLVQKPRLKAQIFRS